MKRSIYETRRRGNRAPVAGLVFSGLALLAAALLGIVYCWSHGLF